MLYVQESYLNATEGHIFGESPIYETYSNTPGELYRAMQEEYGRCVSKVYIDGPDGKAIPIGWDFISKQSYTDCDEEYLREVWVTVHAEPETITRRQHLFNVQSGQPVE